MYVSVREGERERGREGEREKGREGDIYLDILCMHRQRNTEIKGVV